MVLSITHLMVPLLSWLMAPGPVLHHRFVCANKSDTLVDQVELKEVNPNYALESTVSLRDLAPCPCTPMAMDSTDTTDVSQMNTAKVDMRSGLSLALT